MLNTFVHVGSGEELREANYPRHNAAYDQAGRAYLDSLIMYESMKHQQ